MVLTARTGFLYSTAFAVIPALTRETFVAFQGITWKKETNTKIELIAWISKVDTPNYPPMITIQCLCFSTREPFGSKWTLNLCPSPHSFRQASKQASGQVSSFCYTCSSNSIKCFLVWVYTVKALPVFINKVFEFIFVCFSLIYGWKQEDNRLFRWENTHARGDVEVCKLVAELHARRPIATLKEMW